MCVCLIKIGIGKGRGKMEAFNFKVRVPVGIHVRNALLLSQKTAHYQSNIALHKGNRVANAKKLMDIMILRVRCGDEILFIMEGPDEKEMLNEVREFCEKNL